MAKHFHQCICTILKLIQTFGTIFVVAVSFVKFIAKILQFLLICVACLDLLWSFFNDLFFIFIFKISFAYCNSKLIDRLFFLILSYSVVWCSLFVLKICFVVIAVHFERWFKHRQFDQMGPPSEIGPRTNLFSMRDLELYKNIIMLGVKFHKVHSR